VYQDPLAAASHRIHSFGTLPWKLKPVSALFAAIIVSCQKKVGQRVLMFAN
jgi:hypothetical protein